MDFEQFIVDDDPREPSVRAAWDAVLGRLAHQLLPTDLVGFVDALAARQRQVVPAMQALEAAEHRHDESNRAWWQATMATMEAIEDLVEALEAAGLGSDERPFGRFLPCDMPTLKGLMPPWQINSVRCLHRRLLRADVAPELQNLSASMLRSAGVNHEASALYLTHRKEHYAAEDELANIVFEWRRMASKLKHFASYYWPVNSPEYRAVFQIPARPTA